MANVLLKLRSGSGLESYEANPDQGSILVGGQTVSIHDMMLDAPVEGSVYGSFLNTCSQYDKLAPRMHESPYTNPPKAPVLYVKPPNTISADNAVIPLPAGAPGVWVEASIGMVMGCTATRVSEDEAMDYVLGYTLVCDVALPHDAFFRPPLKFRCRDGFCPVGPWIVARADAPDCGQFRLDIRIDGQLVHTEDFSKLKRSPARLLADVTEFLTLGKGDILLLGGPGDAPLAKVGQAIEISAPGLGSLRNTLSLETL